MIDRILYRLRRGRTIVRSDFLRVLSDAGRLRPESPRVVFLSGNR